MEKLSARQREVLAEKFADLGNIAIGSLVFGYVLKSEILNNASLAIGMAIALATYIMTIALSK